jgi:hypothetical protein
MKNNDSGAKIIVFPPRKGLKKVQKPPKNLSFSMKKWWISVNLNYVLEDHHRLLLTKCCEAHDRADAARDKIDKYGPIFKDRFGQPATRPEVAIERDSRLAFARLLRELNLEEPPPAPSRPPRFRS